MEKCEHINCIRILNKPSRTIKECYEYAIDFFGCDLNISNSDLEYEAKNFNFSGISDAEMLVGRVMRVEAYLIKSISGCDVAYNPNRPDHITLEANSIIGKSRYITFDFKNKRVGVDNKIFTALLYQYNCSYADNNELNIYKVIKNFIEKYFNISKYTIITVYSWDEDNKIERYE